MIDPILKYHFHAAQEDLISEIDLAERIVKSMQHGFDLTNRIVSQYKFEDTISMDVLSYIQDYEDGAESLGYERIDIHASSEGVCSVLRDIIAALWRMLLKLWDHIKNAFRWLFSAQYRASKEALGYNQTIAMLNANRQLKELFVGFTVSAMLKPDDLNNYIDATAKLVAVLNDIASLPNLDAIDDFISSNVAAAGLVRKNNAFVDTYGELNYVGGTYGSIGWTSESALVTSKKFVDLMRSTTSLKKTGDKLSSDIAELKRKQNNKIVEGADVSFIQDGLTKKVTMYQVILAGQQALCARISNISVCLKQITTDCDGLVSGRYTEQPA